MYVDYPYYSGVYHGTVPEGAFQEAETWAESYIRYLTFLNGEIFGKEDDSIKRCVCVVSDIYYTAKQEQGKREAEGKPGVVKSENNDGFSASFVVEQVDGQTAEEALRKKAYDAVYLHLLPTGWLSRRVRR